MPYSQKNNILFIHIPKCAGKSFEVALGIATNQEVNKYKWRSNFNRAGKLLLNLTRDENAMPRLWGIEDISLALQHLTYVEIEILNLLSFEILKNAIKVAIVRNPYDRAVSSFKHMAKEGQSFKQFLLEYYNQPNRNHNDLAHKRPQIDFLRDKSGKIAVNNIIHFETLYDDFEKFVTKYNIDTAKLPHIGKQNRISTYKEYYCEETKSLVEKMFKEDIEHLGYNF
jgi:hypothetical protein